MTQSDLPSNMGEKLHQQLLWRYATKLFDKTRQIPANDLKILIESLRLAPSSFGLQPWRFVIVQSPAMREKLADAAPLNRAKIETASHLVVLASLTTISIDYIDAFFARISEARGVPLSALQDYRTMIVNQTQSLSKDVLAQWTARQSYIALGSLLTSAALVGIDSCPMEGIDPAQYDRVLGLADSDYATVVAVALGYRSADDPLQFAKKVRFAEEEVVTLL